VQISSFFLGFFGAGLIFAGLNGYCGLAMLMARIPWNKGHKNSKSPMITTK
jgi:hypothetical protein